MLQGHRARAAEAKEQQARDAERARLFEELLLTPGWRAFEELVLDMIDEETQLALVVFPIEAGKDPTGALARDASIAQRAEINGMKRVLRLPREQLEFVRARRPTKRTEEQHD
jgi:hypothetical protein